MDKNNPHRDKAVADLQHYFALAMGHKSAVGLINDYRLEIEGIVDSIIKAAMAEIERQQPLDELVERFMRNDKRLNEIVPILAGAAPKPEPEPEPPPVRNQFFDIPLVARASVSTLMRVCAPSIEEARRQAIQAAKEGNADWNYDGVDDETIELGEE